MYSYQLLSLDLLSLVYIYIYIYIYICACASLCVCVCACVCLHWSGVHHKPDGTDCYKNNITINLPEMYIYLHYPSARAGCNT